MKSKRPSFAQMNVLYWLDGNGNFARVVDAREKNPLIFAGDSTTTIHRSTWRALVKAEWVVKRRTEVLGILHHDIYAISAKGREALRD